MRIVTADEIERLLAFPDLIAAITDAFRSPVETPLRQHYTIRRGERPDATLLLMPAWTAAEDRPRSPPFVGVKVVSVFPDNVEKGAPSVLGAYLLIDGGAGHPLAVMDGTRLTLWRTAAASALAASRLARPDACRMLMVGAGALAPYLVRAHASVRPIDDVAVWNRTPVRAERLIAELSRFGITARRVEDLESAVRSADLISCATLSSTPLIRGDWLADGVHLDLVGAYRPSMRESDDNTVRRAKLFCDTRGGALHEAGDLVQPLAAGIIAESDVTDLFDLCSDRVPGRSSPDEITLFKSVGTAIEDLAAAMLVWRQLDRTARGFDLDSHSLTR